MTCVFIASVPLSPMTRCQSGWHSITGINFLDCFCLLLTSSTSPVTARFFEIPPAVQPSVTPLCPLFPRLRISTSSVDIGN